MSEPTFPLKKPEFNGGMVISLSGVLDRAADTCLRSRNSKHLEFSLKQLNEHIELLRRSESDEQALEMLAKFLSLWVKN